MIPKTIHICWDREDVVNDLSPMVAHGLRKLIDLNPDWVVTVYSEQEIMDYIGKRLPTEIFKMYDQLHIVEKCDLWRLMKLYEEGGMYVDLDRLCNIPLSDILDENTFCVLPTSGDFDFSQDIMLSEAGNSIYKFAIELIINRRLQGHKNIYFLGPQTYMHAVTACLLSEMIDSNPGKEKFDEIRAKINSISGFKTFREDGPHNTLIYQQKLDEIRPDLESMKREFYAKNNIRHWTNEW